MRTILALCALMLLPLAAASGAITVEPLSNEACCGTAQYVVTVTNDYKVQKSFQLSVDADYEIKVTLQPDLVLVAPKGSEQLVMLVKPECGLAPGEYPITVSATMGGLCEDTCGEICEYAAGEATTRLVVPEGCVPAVEEPEPVPEPVPEPEPVNVTTNETPTGAATGAAAKPMSGNDLFAITILFGMLAVFVILLILIRWSSKDETKKAGSKESESTKSESKKTEAKKK